MYNILYIINKQTGNIIMGMYTDFSLTALEFTETKGSEELYSEMLSYAENNSRQFYEIYELLRHNYCNETKWYRHECDLIEFSKLFPTVAIYIHGVHENIEPDTEGYVEIFDIGVLNGKLVKRKAKLIEPDEIMISDLKGD